MKIVLVSLFFLFGSFVYSQGNLQFSQVLTLTGGISAGPGITTTSSTQTVPAGKVWKIESLGGGSIGTTNTSYLGIIINNGLSIFKQMGNTNTGTGFSNNICPIWLRAGDNVSIQHFNSSGLTVSTSYVISVIEFNIIP